MKALSVRQPWAFAILTGYKPVENRTRRHSHRGPCLLHAGKIEEKQDVIPVLRRLAEESGETLDHWVERYRAQAAFGAIVGRMTVAACVDAHESPWFTGPHAFVIESPAPLHPVSLPGQLGFFDVADSVLRRLRPLERCPETPELPL